MKAEFNINCPLSLDEAKEIQNVFNSHDIELYCGIDQYVITNIGVRRFKHSKKKKKNSIIKKIEYMIKNNI